MDATVVMQQLWDDHRVSAHLLGILKPCLSAALDGDRNALAAMRDVVARESEYGDRVHHAREEMLFSRLASRDTAGADAVKGLTHDHNELARMSASLRETFDNALDGHPLDEASLRMSLERYIDGLRNHMKKEEQRVFRLAVRLLRSEDWEKVAGVFAGAADPMAPPVEGGYRALEQWLREHHEPVFGEQ